MNYSVVVVSPPDVEFGEESSSSQAMDGGIVHPFFE